MSRVVYYVGLIALVASVFLTRPAKGEEFVVINRCPPKFEVVNRIPPPNILPTDPNQPAPAGMRWIRYGDGPWKLEQVAAQAVAAPRPFMDGTRGTAVPAAGTSPRPAPAPGSSGVAVPFPAPTGTVVRYALPRGITDGCAGGRCPTSR